MHPKKVLNSSDLAPNAARIVSAIIVITLFMQAAQIVARTGSLAWPFTNYPMYATAHFDKERLNSGYRIYAIFADGSEYLLDEQDIVSAERESSSLDKFLSESSASANTELAQLNHQQSSRWRPCALNQGGTCVLFYNFLVKSLTNYPENEYFLNRVVPDNSATTTSNNWLYRKLKSAVSRRHIAAKHIDIFTNRAEHNLSKTIAAYRVEDYPAIITRNGWVTAEPANVLKTLHIKR